MKILLVNYRYFISGGPEKYMFNIKKMLEEKGNEVIPFSIHSDKNEPTEYSKYFVEPIGDRNSVYYEDCKKTPKVIWQMISRSFYSFEVKKAIQKEIKEIKPDIVYIIHFVNKLSPSVIRGSKQLGIPVVLRLSDYFMLCPRFDFLHNEKICEDCINKGYRCCIKKRCVKNSLFASMVRVASMKFHKLIKIYDDVDAFITPSQFLKDKLISNKVPVDKIHCIPTFTNEESIENEINVGNYGLYFGRLSEEKGVFTVVKAYEKLKSHKCVIMGDDSTKEAIKIKNYLIEKDIKNIELIGHKSGSELEKIVKNARFVIIPSICYDNLPNTALEAFKHAKPILASNLGSFPELVVEKRNGYLFEPGDEKELSEKICLLDDEGIVKNMGEESRKLLFEKFSAESHYNKLNSLFNDLVKEHE